MAEPWQSWLLVLLFVLVGGVFAAAEIALVSLREGQVQALSKRGVAGPRVLRLASDPNRFLAVVQVGVTVAGFFSAAFGAATLADDLVAPLADLGIDEGAAEAVALVLVTLFIAYLSLVFGELVPKRLALQRAESFSLVVALPLDVLATLLRPVIWFLSASTNVMVRLLGGDPSITREEISEEELRALVSGHESLTDEERNIVTDVFDAGDRQIRELMLPRTEVEFLDGSLRATEAAGIVDLKPHSRYPVITGSPDDVVGFVHVRDLLQPLLTGADPSVADLARDIVVLPGTKRVLPALSEMRSSGNHLAIVLDEYGGTDGIVTLEDLVEELIGDIRDEYDASSWPATAASGARVVDGLLNLDDFEQATGIELPDGPYETVAGYVVARLGTLPQMGRSVDVAGVRLTIVGLDGRRISRLTLNPLPDGGATDGTGASDAVTEPLKPPGSAESR